MATFAPTPRPMRSPEHFYDRRRRRGVAATAPRPRASPQAMLEAEQSEMGPGWDMLKPGHEEPDPLPPPEPWWPSIQGAQGVPSPLQPLANAVPNPPDAPQTRLHQWPLRGGRDWGTPEDPNDIKGEVLGVRKTPKSTESIPIGKLKRGVF